MSDRSAVQGGTAEEIDWLPPGIVSITRASRRRRAPFASWGLEVAARALERAPLGRVSIVADRGESRFTNLAPVGRHIEIVDVHEVAGGGVPMGDDHRGDLAACILDGLLERVDRPAALLDAVRQRLAPGGMLILTAGSADTPTALLRLFGRDDRQRVYPGQTVASQLFHSGYEAPEFYRRGRHRLVVARRGGLPPVSQRAARLSVIMPVYNERETFEKAIELVLAKEIPDTEIDVIIVESNSTDGTREKVLDLEPLPRVSVILEDEPRGKGHAVRRGLEAAQGDFILIQDADLEYDVDDYAILLEPLRRGETGFVLGMRTKPDGSWGVRHFGEDTTMSHTMNLGHLVFLALFNVVYGQRLRDPFTMYKVFRRDCLHGLELECNRFDFDWELTGKLIRSGYRPLEIPVSYQSRSFAEGKKIRLVRDPLTWIVACFRHRFSRLHTYD